MTSYFRISYKIPIDNYLLNDVQKKYKDTFNLIKKIINSKDLKNELGIEIDDNEIAFLTVFIEGHMLSTKQKKPKINIIIACNHGTHTSNLIKSEIENIFYENINVLGIINTRDIKKCNYKYDLILTTSEIKIDDEKIIKINPIFSKNDIKLIKKHINRIHMNLKDARDILGESFVKLIDKKLSINEAIRESHSVMLKNKIVEKSYVNKIIEDAKTNHSYFVIPPHLALPHAASKYGVNKLGLEITLFKQPIIFNENKINLFISLATPDNEQHLGVLDDISKFIRDDELTRDLIDSNSEEELFIKIFNILKNKGEEDGKK
jgi:mannitol/fructose-specific phosphotransferase system IIA component (Ntr-type)/galactitol-specific phosphotransferase system IIB component